MMKKIILLLIFMSLTGPASADKIVQTPSFKVRDVHIIILGGTPARKEKLQSLARKIIRINKGEPLSSKILLEAIELLKQTRQFSSINVPDPEPENDAIDLRFMLTPSKLIRKISVKGAFPVFKDDVIDKTDFIVGGSFHPNTLEKNIQSIKELFLKNGYADPDIQIVLDPVGDLELAVLIKIEKGEDLKIRHIELNGNKRYSDTRLKMQMKSYPLPLFFWSKGKRFEQENLDKDMKKLVAFYRENGFYEVVITHQIERDSQKKFMKLIVNIDEGPEYRLSFSGNNAFWTYTLKKELTLSKKGNTNDFGLKKSVKNIQQKYRAAGYQDCKVVYTAQKVEEGDKNFRDVHVQVDENTRYIVRSSKINGTNAFEEKLVKQEILTLEKTFFYDGPFAKSKLKEDNEAIQNYYTGHGFTDTRVKSRVNWDQKADDGVKYGDAVFDVAEGYQKNITAVLFFGLPMAFEQEITPLLETKPGTPFMVSRIQKDRQTILSFLAEKGYIYSGVEAKIIPGTEKEACSIEFVVVKQTQVNAGGVWTFGNFRTKDSVLLRHNSIQPDEPVSLTSFMDLQKNIRDLNCIERLDFRALGIKEKLDQLYFIVDVEEKKPYYLETSIGYDTAKDAYFEVSLGDKNFSGANRELYLNAEVSGIGYDAALGINEFDFLSQHILTRFSIYASEEELKNLTFGSRKYGLDLSFEKKVSRFLKAGTNFSLESREEYPLDDPLLNDPEVYTTRGIAAMTPFIEWNSVDSFVKPTKGVYFNASAGYHRDVLEDLDNFIKYRAKAKYYYPVFPRLVMAFQGMVGHIQNFAENSELPDDQLFFLGGISDVRGFAENELIVDSFKDPVGGRTQILGSIEIRIDLGMNFEIPLFLDAGSIKGTNVAGSNDDFKYSIGSGIRYMTPVGPVGLLYGYKLNPEDGEDASRLHFSIGYTF